MSDYRRYFTPGGTFFFTVVTQDRQQILCTKKGREFLHESILEIKNNRPFESLAFVLLPEHFHCIWKLPQEDGNFTVRMACIKKLFTQKWLENGGEEIQISKTRQNHREKGIWQKRFWEHTIRNEEDFINHVNYIHYNPIKHNLTKCPHEWLCICNSNKFSPRDFNNIIDLVGE